MTPRLALHLLLLVLLHVVGDRLSTALSVGFSLALCLPFVTVSLSPLPAGLFVRRASPAAIFLSRCLSNACQPLPCSPPLVLICTPEVTETVECALRSRCAALSEFGSADVACEARRGESRRVEVPPG